MASEEKSEYSVEILRALLNSRKYPVTFNLLLKEYREIEGKAFPFKNYGYKTFEEYLNSTNQFVLINDKGETLVSARPNKVSEHISKMVSRQRAIKRRSKRSTMKPTRMPKKFDNSWNTSSYSETVRKETKQRVGDSNNNTNSSNNRNLRNSNEKITQQKIESTNRSNKQDESKELTNKQQQKSLPKQNPNNQTKVTHKLINNKASQQQNNFQKANAKNINDRLKVLQYPTQQDETTTPEDENTSIISSTAPISNNKMNINNKNQDSNSLTKNKANTINKNLVNSAVITDKHTNNKTKKILPPTEKYQFDLKLDPVNSLENYCIARGYPKPIFNVKQTKFTQKNYICSVIINDKTYTTYPKCFKDSETAKYECSASAIEEIKAAESNMTSYPICKDADKDLITRIYQELKTNHPGGIFMKMFPKLFESKFQARLPGHWTDLIKKSKYFVLETTIDSQNTIMTPNLNIFEKDLSSIEKDELIINPLILPWDSKYWNLYITHCVSTIEVWARIVDKEYSQQLDSLLNDIDLAMLTEKKRPTALATGQMYLICISECWHRVRLERMDKGKGKCLCFFIDFGDEDWISMDQLYVCDKRFLTTPPQAIPFSLFGLEDFAENPIADRHLNEMLMGRTFVALIHTKRETYEANNSVQINGSNETLSEIVKIQAILYDTSSDVDVILNSLLINKINDDTPPPQLKQNGTTSVKITHVAENGDIYLQVLDSGLNYVQKLITQLVESKFQKDQHRVQPCDINASNLYLVYDSDTKLWCRGCLADSKECEKKTASKFRIYFVDYGFEKVVNTSNMFRLESLSAALRRYPKQCLKAKLYNLPPLNEFLLKRLKTLLQGNSVAIVKLAFNKLDTDRNPIPQIILFVRIKQTQTLCNVNDAIRMEYELNSNNDAMNMLDKELSSVDSKCSSPTSPQPKMITEISPFTKHLTLRSPGNVSSVGELTRGALPKLNTNIKWPKKGEIFNVLVTIASNPFNFFVRPYNDFLAFQNMMKELQRHCKEHDEFIPNDMIEIGESYAVWLDDHFYHRAIIEQILPNQMCVVYFCDFGDRNVVEIQKLRTLPAQCRELATQAIPAKLSDVIPAKGEWSLEDSIRFGKLVIGNKFASVVRNISYDNFDPNNKSKVLELLLIDVLTPTDIYIHQILIDEKRAVEAPSK